MSRQQLTFRILGCGSSGGVPRIGNRWGSCDPNEPKNRRLRCSLLVSKGEQGALTQVLVDTSPDLREQLLAAKCSSLDAVVYTHDHADQSHGLDDLRPVSYMMRRRIPTYMDKSTSDTLLRRFEYAFAQAQTSAYPAILDAREMPPLCQPFAVDGAGGAISVIPFVLDHGPTVQALGFRFGSVVYTPDVSNISMESAEVIQGADTWIIDALRPDPHPTHFHLQLALDWAEQLQPRRVILTNMHNSMDYQSLRAQLPDHVVPAYDGMEITVSA